MFKLQGLITFSPRPVFYFPRLFLVVADLAAAHTILRGSTDTVYWDYLRLPPSTG